MTGSNRHTGSGPVFEGAAYLAAAGELSKALERHVPIIVVTDPASASKRTLEQLLGTCCGPRTLVTAVNSVPGDIQDFLREVLEGFGLLTKHASEATKADTRYDDLVGVLDRFLASLRSLDAVALIVVNDATDLDPELLDQMRTLSDLKADASHRPLRIVLGSSGVASSLDAIQLNGEQSGPVGGPATSSVSAVGHRAYLRLRLTTRTMRFGIAAGLFIAVTTIVGWMMRDAVAVSLQQPDSSVGIPVSKPVLPSPAEQRPSESTASPTYVPMVPAVRADVSPEQNTPSAVMPSGRSAPVRPVVTATITPKHLQDVAVSELLQMSDALSHKPDVRSLEQLRTEVMRRQSSSDFATSRDELRAALAQVESALDTARQLQLEQDGRRLAAGVQ